MRMSAAYTELRIVLQRAYAHISVRMTHNGEHCAAEAAAGYVSKIATTTGLPPNQVETSLQVVVFIEGRRQGSPSSIDVSGSNASMLLLLRTQRWP